MNLADGDLRIGGVVPLRNRVLLAPMAGLTDAVTRHLAWRFGAGYTVGEMVASQPQLWHTRKSAVRRVSLAGSGPTVVQIAGYDPQAMAEVARRHVDEGAAVIDINFGCPAKKVCKRAAVSALLAQPELVGAIVEVVASAVGCPVTIKMRTGPAPDLRNGVAVARLAERSGAAAISVHGRTRACRFKGTVEHDTVSAIKAAVSVPVFANGDIHTPEEASAVLRYASVDGVMIGRAAMGQPWLLGVMAGRALPRRSERWETVLEHAELTYELYGVETGVRVLRKHVQAYLGHLGATDACSKFNQLDSPAAQLRLLDDRRQQDLGDNDDREPKRASAA